MVNGCFNPGPDGQIGKDLHDAALIGKRRLLQNRKIFHDAIFDNVFDNLIDEIDLPAVQVDAGQILGKGVFSSIHVHPDDFTDEFSQRLLTTLGLIILLCADIAPEDFFQFSNVLLCQGNVGVQLCNCRIILMLTDIKFRFGLVIFQIIVFQIGFFPFNGEEIVREIGFVNFAIMGQVFHQVPQRFPDMLELIDAGIVQIIGVQDFFHQLRLGTNFGNRGNTGYSSDFLAEILACTGIFLPHKVGQLDSVQESIKANGTGFILVGKQQGSDFVPQIKGIFITECSVALGIRKFLHIPQMLADSEMIPVQFLYFGEHLVHQFLSEWNQVSGLISQVLQFIDDLRFQIENSALQGHLSGNSLVLFHAEEFKVPAQIENIKLILVFSIHQSRAKPGAAANHLPEFCLAHNLFEKDQIQHFRHVDAGIQHINRNGNLGQLLRV